DWNRNTRALARPVQGSGVVAASGATGADRASSSNRRAACSCLKRTGEPPVLRRGAHRPRRAAAPCAKSGYFISVIRVVLLTPGPADKPRLLTVKCAQVRPLPPSPACDGS